MHHRGSPDPFFRIVEPHPVEVEVRAGYGVEKILAHVVFVFRPPRSKPLLIVLLGSAEEGVREGIMIA